MVERSWLLCLCVVGCSEYGFQSMKEGDLADTGALTALEPSTPATTPTTPTSISTPTTAPTATSTTSTPTEPDSLDATTTGTEFWLAFMENLSPAFNGPPEFAIVVSAEADTTGFLEVPRTGLQIPFSVAAGSATEVMLPDATWHAMGSEVTADLGLRVSTDQPVQLAAVHYRLYFSDATLVLPTTELGSRYAVIAAEDWYGQSPSSFVVVATQDDSSVTITPSVLTSGLHAAGAPFTVELHRGQSYQVQGSGDLSGTVVESAGGAIAVFAGARQAAVDCSADSHVMDQTLPISRWGSSYLVAPFDGQGGDPVKIVASEPGTTVRLDCGDPLAVEPGAPLDVRVDAPTWITSSAPVGVAQLNKGQACNASGLGDPSLLVHAPSRLTRTSAVFRSLDSHFFEGGDDVVEEEEEGEHGDGGGDVATGGPLDFVNIVSPAGEPALWVDGVDRTADLVPAGPFSVLSLQLDAGEHRVESTLGFAATAYGFSQYDAYTYGLGYDCEGCADAVEPTCP